MNTLTQSIAITDSMMATLAIFFIKNAITFDLTALERKKEDI